MTTPPHFCSETGCLGSVCECGGECVCATAMGRIGGEAVERARGSSRQPAQEVTDSAAGAADPIQRGTASDAVGGGEGAVRAGACDTGGAVQCDGESRCASAYGGARLAAPIEGAARSAAPLHRIGSGFAQSASHRSGPSVEYGSAMEAHHDHGDCHCGGLGQCHPTDPTEATLCVCPQPTATPDAEIPLRPLPNQQTHTSATTPAAPARTHNDRKQSLSLLGRKRSAHSTDTRGQAP